MSDLNVGDSSLPYLDVTPADLSTQATLTVIAPDGTSTALAATGGALTAAPGNPAVFTQRWTAVVAVVYNQPTRWLLRWTVTGTGQGVEDVEVWVNPLPLPGGAVWAPSLTQVADFVPYLTVDTTTPGSQLYLGTFTGDTTPTGEVAQRHVDAAVAMMLPAIPTISSALFPAARTVAAMRAAASLARSYPRRPEDLSEAAALEARADTAWKVLETAAEQEGADPEADEPILIAPNPGCGHFHYFYY